jgi:hypothetical protein
MAIYKNIFLRPDFQETETHVWANIHYLQGYTAETVTAFMEMADKLRESLPGLTILNSEVRCGQVVESTYCKGFSLVAWNGLIPKENSFKESGWNVTNRPPDYATT